MTQKINVIWELIKMSLIKFDNLLLLNGICFVPFANPIKHISKFYKPLLIILVYISKSLLSGGFKFKLMSSGKVASFWHAVKSIKVILDSEYCVFFVIVMITCAYSKISSLISCKTFSKCSYDFNFRVVDFVVFFLFFDTRSSRILSLWI